MSDHNGSSAGGGGIGFVGLLTIVFVTLKLCGVIQWPWLWVLSPIWISFLLFLSMLAIFGVVILCWYLFAYRGRKR